MRRLHTPTALIAGLSLISLITSPAEARKRATKLEYSFSVSSGHSCTALQLNDEASGAELTYAMLSDLRYRRGVYKGSVNVSTGDYSVSGLIECDSGDYAVSSFAVSLSAGDTHRQALDIDFSAPIVEEPALPLCDDDVWPEQVAGLDTLLSEVAVTLQSLRYHVISGMSVEVEADLSALSALLEEQRASHEGYISGEVAVYSCAFYACPEAPEVGVERSFEASLFTVESLGLDSLDLSDLYGAVSSVDSAIEVIAAERAGIGAEYQVLNSAAWHQCSFGYIIASALSRQESLASAAASPYSTDSDRSMLQIEYQLLSEDITRVAEAAGCEASAVNGCDADGACPQVSTVEEAEAALEAITAAESALSVCAF